MLSHRENHLRPSESGEFLRPVLSGPTLSSLLSYDGMSSLRPDVRVALSGTAPVLLTGESGTGKTLLARAMAEASGRLPVVRAMLGASDDVNTITSELFGHERGSFSGALGRRVGLVEHADGGTLILDEILNLPMHAQQLLLDFTQFGTYRPLGHAGAEAKRSDAWLIVATHGDLKAAVAEGKLREDLYYRLAGVEIRLPALRERRNEIPALAIHLLDAMDHGARGWALSPGARQLLLCTARTWPGNIRELSSLLSRGRSRALLEDSSGSVVRAEHLDPRAEERMIEPIGLPGPAAGTRLRSDAWSALQAVRDRVEQRERALIHDALRDHAGVITRAARDLGIPRTTLASRLKKLGIDPRFVTSAGR